MSLDAMKQWFSDMQKEVHVLGPLLPAGYYGIETRNTEEGASLDIEAFLGKMLVQHGKKSVFFVRFFFLSLALTNLSSDFLWNYTLAHSFRIP